MQLLIHSFFIHIENVSQGNDINFDSNSIYFFFSKIIFIIARSTRKKRGNGFCEGRLRHILCERYDIYSVTIYIEAKNMSKKYIIR